MLYQEETPGQAQDPWRDYLSCMSWEGWTWRREDRASLLLTRPNSRKQMDVPNTFILILDRVKRSLQFSRQTQSEMWTFGSVTFASAANCKITFEL